MLVDLSLTTYCLEQVHHVYGLHISCLEVGAGPSDLRDFSCGFKILGL